MLIWLSAIFENFKCTSLEMALSWFNAFFEHETGCEDAKK